MKRQGQGMKRACRAEKMEKGEQEESMERQWEEEKTSAQFMCHYMKCGSAAQNCK